MVVHNSNTPGVIGSEQTSLWLSTSLRFNLLINKLLNNKNEQVFYLVLSSGSS